MTLNTHTKSIQPYNQNSRQTMIMMMMYRWAPDKAMDKQPDYLRFVWKFILYTFEEFQRELGPEGRSYSVNATIEEVTN